MDITDYIYNDDEEYRIQNKGLKYLWTFFIIAVGAFLVWLTYRIFINHAFTVKKVLILLLFFLFTIPYYWTSGFHTFIISRRGVDSYYNFFGARMFIKHLDPGEYSLKIETVKTKYEPRNKIYYVSGSEKLYMIGINDTDYTRILEGELHDIFSHFQGYARLNRIESTPSTEN